MPTQTLGVDLGRMVGLYNNKAQFIARREDGSYTYRERTMPADSAQVIDTELVTRVEDVNADYEIRCLTPHDGDPNYPVVIYFVVKHDKQTGDVTIIDRMRMAAILKHQHMIIAFLEAPPSTKLALFDC